MMSGYRPQQGPFSAVSVVAVIQLLPVEYMMRSFSEASFNHSLYVREPSMLEEVEENAKRRFLQKDVGAVVSPHSSHFAL